MERLAQAACGHHPNTPSAGRARGGQPGLVSLGWARLLKRVFSIDMEHCPRCQQGTLRLIAALTSRPIIGKILCHLKRAAEPPPSAPARLSQERFAWASP